MEITCHPEQLTGFGERIIEGFSSLLESLGLPKGLGKPAIAALTALRKKDADYRASLSPGEDTLGPALLEADRQAELAIYGATDILRHKVSECWTPIWGEAGFYGNHTQRPVYPEGRAVLLGNLATFFSNRPEWENAALGLTADNLRKAGASLKFAIAAVDQQEAKQKQLFEERDRLASRLRDRLRNIIDELNHVMAEDDPRWADFGFETPVVDRAGKPTQGRNAKGKSQALAVKRAEAARAVAETARVRAEKALAAANKLKAIADLAAVKAVAALESANPASVVAGPEDTGTAGFPQRGFGLGRRNPTRNLDPQGLGESALAS